jgi:branched-chain amino acid aminotransferase
VSDERANQTELANVNGVIAPIDRAAISVTDHGFLYGESVYETIRTYRRRAFLVGRHLERLERSAASILLALPWTRDHLAGEVSRTLAAAGEGTGEYAIRIVTTRGDGPFGYDPALCPRPNLVILLRRLSEPASDPRAAGVSAAISAVRRNPIESLDPRIKSSNLLNNILAAHDARRAGADEAVLFNTAGFLSEGTQSNIFFVAGGTLRTPSLDCGLLSGVTRDLVLDLAGRMGIPRQEGRYRRAELEGADEIFLTSTTREVLPISRLDGRPVGEGCPGPVTLRLHDGYRALVERFLASGEEGI